jgi:hypothetical protein
MKKIHLLVIVASLIFSISAAHASASAQRYSLKGEARVGSYISTVGATSNIPFNKRFDALTLEQQNLVKAKFVDLGANDTPPFPVSGLRAVYKPVVKANANYGDNSELNITAKISSLGFVEKVTVHGHNNAALVAHIESSLRKTKFQPAQCNGIACDMDFPIEISFN